MSSGALIKVSKHSPKGLCAMRFPVMAAILGVMTWLCSATALAQTGASATNSTAPAATSATDVGDGGATPAAAETASSSAAPGAAADAGQAMTGEQYVVRLRDLEQRINELKEEIFRSKARLSLLAESVLQNVVGGARAMIHHQNEMGQSFRLVRAVYALDGAPILTRADEEGSLAELHEFPVYNGQIGAGDHTLTVNLEYQGNGFGIFSYVKGYTFRVRSTQSFSVPDGKAIEIRVVGYEKGGPTTPPEERPAVRYIQRVMSLRDAAEAEQRSDQGSSGAPANAGGAQQQGGAGTNP
jgi:hypothetical protein